SSFMAPELLARAMGHGCRFIEVPIAFIPRTGGEAKGTKLRSIVRSVTDIWRNWFRWGWRFRWSRRGAPKQIWRVAEPFILEEDVLRLVVPLFKSFRSRQPRGATPAPRPPRAATALPDDGRLDVGAVRRDATAYDVEVSQDELEGGDPVAERRSGVEPGGVGADVVEHEVASRLERAVEMLRNGQRAGQVLER